MLYRLIFVCVLLLLPACTTESVVENNAKPDTTESVAIKPTDPNNPNKQPAALEQVAEEAKGLLEALLAEFEKAQSKWMQQSPDERLALLGSESRPSQEYAEKLVDLAKKYPDTESAKQALRIAVKIGMREPKTTASQAILAAAIAEPDLAKSMQSLEFLMKYSLGSPQKEAVELMLSRAMEHKNPDSAFNIIEKIVTSSTSLTIHADVVLTSSEGREIRGDMLLGSGNLDGKQKAIQQLLAIVDFDVKSEKAVKCLTLIYKNSNEEGTRDNAIAQLLEHHPAHSQTMKHVQSLGRYATVKNENLIKQAMSSSNEKVKTNAAIALSHLFWEKQLTAQYYESVSHDIADGTKNEIYQAYLKAKPNPADLAKVEETLAAYIATHNDENDDMLVAAKNTLFAMQNLAIGKQAPEIVGEDLDGVEFKLSDYRGQIVFLNFWGDW